jgi:hypothetical protein
MALLVYSDRCQYSQDILGYIKGNPGLVEVMRFWNVTEQGSPSPRITRVPTLITNEGNVYIGSDIRGWLETMKHSTSFDSWDPSSGKIANLDDTDDPLYFELDNYGTPLQPKLTPELEKKIGSEVQSAYQSYSQNIS